MNFWISMPSFAAIGVNGRAMIQPERSGSRGDPRLVRSALVLLLCLFVADGCRAGREAEPRGTSSGSAPVLPALIVNDSLGVEDRCTTCHRGVLDVSKKLEPQPLTTHPGRLLDIHDPRRFGCTPCHGGRGAALGAREAHAGGATHQGFLTGDATEISCGKCHLNELELDGAPHLSRGRSFIRHYQCDGCHQIGEVARRSRPAPDLSGIARRANPRWLFRWIKNPRDYAENARMPRYDLEDKHVDALVGYLMTFREQAPFDSSRFPAGNADRGQDLFRLSFCISCHSVDGKGGKDAIDLGRIGNKLTRAWILRLLSDTHEADPGTPMPQYRFTPAQVADVAAYLTGALVDPSFAGAESDSALERLDAYWPTEATRIDVGRRLFKELRCGNCHAFPGGGGWLRVSPILARLGEKKVSDISWGSTRFPRTLEDYIWHKVEKPDVFATAPHQLKMPTYSFAPDEARDVAIALLAQADLPVLDDVFLIRDRSDDSLSLSGEFGRLVQRYRCFSCHAVNGIGHNISYDLGVEGSRVKRDWLYQYLRMPYTLRPILTVRMPIFNLSDEEARILASGIGSLMRDDGIDSAGNFHIGPREIEVGRSLFERSGCRSCHQVGSKGGYVGPSFTSGTPIGRKLEPGWIVRWLEDPQALKPDVLEPRYGFTREQARAIAAYLMTLKQPEARRGS